MSETREVAISDGRAMAGSGWFAGGFRHPSGALCCLPSDGPVSTCMHLRGLTRPPHIAILLVSQGENPRKEKPMRTHLEDIDSSQAGQWTEEHGFDDGQSWANDDGKTLVGLLDEQEGVERQERRIRFEDGDELTLPVWRFPDGSGVVEIRSHWDLMGPDGRMEYAEIVGGE